jgi:hypothetical protein
MKNQKLYSLRNRISILLSVLLFGLWSNTSCTNNAETTQREEGGRTFAALQLNELRSIAVDTLGNLYLPDPGSSTLFKVTPGGIISALRTVPIKVVFAVAIDGNGSIVVADAEHSEIYHVDGTNDATPIVPDQSDLFYGVTTIGFDVVGNLYVGENDVNIVRKVSSDNKGISIHAGSFKQRGNQDGVGADARITRPRGIAVTEDGVVYVADEAASIIRRITQDGVVTTIAGAERQTGSDDGEGKNARFSKPRGLTVDKQGNVYVMDTDNHTIRKITPEGIVSTVAGKAGDSGFVDGIGSEARFAGPRAATIDSGGNIFVADENNSAVRMISPEGKVTTMVAPKRATTTSTKQ